MPSPSQPSNGASGPPQGRRIARPRSDLLDAIEQDGIDWKGEVVIVGQDGDIPAWLFVTGDRIVLTNRDTTLLEAPRSWLVPAPVRVEERGVRLSITPEGVVPGRGATERLLLMVLDGQGPANQIVAILSGRARRQHIEAELPSWKPGVGAGRSLPPLPAFERSQDTPPPTTNATDNAETRGETPPLAPAIPFRAPETEPAEPQSRAARFLATRTVADTSPEPENVQPTTESARVTSIEKERRTRGAVAGIWLTRIAMLVIVVLVAGWFARPYLPDDVTDRLPAAIVGDQTDPDDVALQSQTPASTSAEQGDGTTGAGTNPSDIMPTQAALGVGGATSDVPAGTGGGETGPEDSVLPTPTPPADTGDEGAGGEGPGDTGSGETLPGAVPPSTEPAPTENTDPPADVPDDPPADTGETQPEPTAPPVVIEPTAPPVEETEIPTETAVATETQTPTEIAVATETQTPTETAVATETQTPTETAVATETQASTEPPVEATAAPTGTSVPTEPPVEETAVPTQAPVERSSTPTAERIETEAPVEPKLESQPASVSPDEPPAQEFVQDGIRYSVDGAASGTSLAELPEIAEVSYGEWIVLAIDGQNMTGTNQVFDMRQFALIADGATIQLDVGNSWVASLMGYSPAYGNTDAILWAPGEQHRFVLTFLAPLGAESLTLETGDQQFDLSGILEMTSPLGAMQETTIPDTIDATVVDVLDGETIVVEKDGIRQTVRYLGIDVPTGDACYASKSTEANRALVADQTVKIERQATDVDAKGNWVRDVWIQQEDGRYALVAHQLVQEGAALADISQPNTRFASWLRGADAAANAEGRGLWGTCGQGSAPADDLIVAQPAEATRRVQR